MLEEIEITQPLDLTADQFSALELHSVINILNVIRNEIELFNLDHEDSALGSLSEEIRVFAHSMYTHAAIDQLKVLLSRYNYYSKEFQGILEDNEKLSSDPKASESLSNIQSVESVLSIRVEEVLVRFEQPHAWKEHSIRGLLNNYINLFSAIEKNSKGRYRIIYNIAAQEEKDYYVNLTIESVDDPMIYMPPVFQDVFRDLIANARKYTPVGGKIIAGLLDDGKCITILVEDNGMGIPKDQIPEVIQYGFRAANAEGKNTMGGGFGLTKAYHITKSLDGRMWIASEENVGTRVKIQVPSRAISTSRLYL